MNLVVADLPASLRSFPLKDTGIRLYDVKFMGQSFLYELALNEAVAHYTDNDPVQSGTSYLDSFYVSQSIPLLFRSTGSALTPRLVASSLPLAFSFLYPFPSLMYTISCCIYRVSAPTPSSCFPESTAQLTQRESAGSSSLP